MHYNTTIVSSVIFYQCRQSGFAPSSSSAVCMENEMWSPDPSQVVCRMVTTGRERTASTALPHLIDIPLCNHSQLQWITCGISDHNEVDKPTDPQFRKITPVCIPAGLLNVHYRPFGATFACLCSHSAHTNTPITI